MYCQTLGHFGSDRAFEVTRTSRTQRENVGLRGERPRCDTNEGKSRRHSPQESNSPGGVCIKNGKK